MNQSSQPASQGSNALAWIGLLLGIVIILGMFWDSFSGHLSGRSNSQVIELTTENWQQEVVESKIPVVVDFWASWCGPCKMLSPIIDQLATKYEGRVKFAKVNVDESKSLAAKYRISTLPQLYFFKGGEIAIRPIEGLVTDAELANTIDRVLQMH